MSNSLLVIPNLYETELIFVHRTSSHEFELNEKISLKTVKKLNKENLKVFKNHYVNFRHHEWLYELYSNFYLNKKEIDCFKFNRFVKKLPSTNITWFNQNKCVKFDIEKFSLNTSFLQFLKMNKDEVAEKLVEENTPIIRYSFTKLDKAQAMKLIESIIEKLEYDIERVKNNKPMTQKEIDEFYDYEVNRLWWKVSNNPVK